MQQPDSTEKPVKYAGFGIRVMASIVDIFSTVLLIPIFNLFDRLSGTDAIRAELQATLDQAQADPGSISAQQLGEIFMRLSPSMLFQLLFVAVLVVLAWKYFSATPGKMLFKLKIVDAVTGNPPSTWQSIIRFIGSIIAFIPLSLGFIWVHYDKKHQGWHDKMAGTVVIDCKKPGL